MAIFSFTLPGTSLRENIQHKTAFKYYYLSQRFLFFQLFAHATIHRAGVSHFMHIWNWQTGEQYPDECILLLK